MKSTPQPGMLGVTELNNNSFRKSDGALKVSLINTPPGTVTLGATLAGGMQPMWMQR